MKVAFDIDKPLRLIVVFGGITLVIIVAIGIYWWQRGDAFLAQPPSDTSGPEIQKDRVAELYENCARVEIPETELDTTLDPENKIAVVRWWDGKLQQNISIELPYELDRGFNGCSESAKKALRHLQEIPKP